MDKGVDNKGITVENMCKRWIKQAFPKENSLLTKPEAASGKGKKHNVQRMGFSFKPLNMKGTRKILKRKAGVFDAVQNSK